jgi:hypothetical protein
VAPRHGRLHDRRRPCRHPCQRGTRAWFLLPLCMLPLCTGMGEQSSTAHLHAVCVAHAAAAWAVHQLPYRRRLLLAMLGDGDDGTVSARLARL